MNSSSQRDDDDDDVAMTTDSAAVNDIEHLMSVCQTALDDEILKMNQVSLSLSLSLSVIRHAIKLITGC